MTGPVAVIGGCGFIGSHLVDRLAARGVVVRVVSRSGHWTWGRRPEGATFHPVDLGDADAAMRLIPVVAGAACVVNLAGVLFRTSVPRGAFDLVHVAGVRSILDSMTEIGSPPRFIHVSTTGVLGPTGTDPLREDAPMRPSTIYERSKAQGERLVLEAAAAGLETTVVRPGLVYGPRDMHLLGLFRSIDSGTYRAIGGARAVWQPIHVADVVDGLLAAMDGNRVPSGRVFHLAGAERVPLGVFAGRIAEHLGRRLRGPGLPVPIALAAGLGLEIAYRPFGFQPPLSRSRVRTMTQHRVYSIDRARSELGFTPRTTLDDGIAGTVAWYRDNGFLQA